MHLHVCRVMSDVKDNSRRKLIIHKLYVDSPMYSWFGLDLLVLINENLYAAVYNEILDNSALPNLWQGPFLLEHDNTPIHKVRSSSWTSLCAQHQCSSSLMLLWLNGSKSLQPGSKKAFPEDCRMLQQQINAHGFGMTY